VARGMAVQAQGRVEVRHWHSDGSRSTHSPSFLSPPRPSPPGSTDATCPPSEASTPAEATSIARHAPGFWISCILMLLFEHEDDDLPGR
jgi:hypothetical protein